MPPAADDRLIYSLAGLPHASDDDFTATASHIGDEMISSGLHPSACVLQNIYFDRHGPRLEAKIFSTSAGEKWDILIH